jgi:membrane protein DedA with SNARE-associated domain/DNA-binding transcriptional ArsR family regulator
MAFLQGLHGTVAIIVLCTLLFAEEAGVPLPFAPGELTLIVAGLLIAVGAINPFVFLPLAVIACIAGALLGYSWAGLIGTGGLRSIAERLHQTKAFDRVENRLRTASSRDIALSRLIPGLRIYTTLVAGAVGVNRGRFIAGITPVTTAWVLVFVVLGAVAGVPVEHLFNNVARLALQGGILVVMGLGGYFAIRKIPMSDAAGIIALPRSVRVAIAAIIDVTLIVSVVTGVLSIGRRVFGVGLIDGWLDGLIALIVVTVFYVYLARRGAGGTVGESLLQTTYASGRPITLRPRSAVRAARSLFTRSDDDLHATADQLRALGDANRLRLVQHLLQGPRSTLELSRLTMMAEPDIQHELSRLQAANVIVADGRPPATRYRLAAPLIGPLADLLGDDQRLLSLGDATKDRVVSFDAGDPGAGDN